MAKEKKIKRVCACCGRIDYCFHRFELARICISCTQKKKAEETIKRQKLAIESFGYDIIGEPIQDNNRKNRYTVRNRECGHEFQMVFGNWQTGVKKALAKGIEKPCAVCGPTRRAAIGLAGYIEKHGRDYDIKKWEDYNKLSRKLTEATYREHFYTINPNNLPRGKKDYHLDHIIPLMVCFLNDIPPEEAAKKENLQMLDWFSNISKGKKLQEDLGFIFPFMDDDIE